MSDAKPRVWKFDLSGLALVAIVAVCVVFGWLERRDCAKACAGRGYSYGSEGCCAPDKCVCAPEATP
jgi:hypothetical protein